MKKRVLVVFLSFTLILITACGNQDDSFNMKAEISVVSREDGSGTRGSFITLFGIEEKGENGSRQDLTTDEAIITNATDVMLTTIVGDKSSIGYVSLGSLNTAVKTLKIDGVMPSAQTVKDGSYKISRSFLIATNQEVSIVAEDFIQYILSSDGQEVVSKMYAPIDDTTAAYEGDLPAGKVVVSGSSSVAPIMEKLKEAYENINPNAKIEIQQSDSTTGMQAVLNGTCDIGMSSRDLNEDEASQLKGIDIALDGIVIVVNKNNPIDDLSAEMVRKIFTGEVLHWEDIEVK